MDMSTRNQYLKVFQERYFMAKSKKEKSCIPDEYCRTTGQNKNMSFGKYGLPFPHCLRKEKKAHI